MKNNLFNVVVDGQWGSCGKGLISTAIAIKHKPKVISTTNMANAGHTAINHLGDQFVAKAVPSGAVINKWSELPGIDGYKPSIFIGSSAAFHLDRILEEIKFCCIEENIVIHDRAGVITQQHQNQEADNKNGTKHIASTMQGCGAFLADKIMRRLDLKLARDYIELKPYLASTKIGFNTVQYLLNILASGSILHEGSQGFSLDINHGSHYPQCTSRGTTAVQNLADMGLPAQVMGDIYLVIRPFPIRVGNVIENEHITGYSGDCYPDQNEITWECVSREAGAPPEVTKGELTTVTKRLRRVFTFSETQLIEAVNSNGATKIALNFANYIDWSCYGVNDYCKLPDKVMSFVKKIEDISNVPVEIIGTGPRNNHVCFRY